MFEISNTNISFFVISMLYHMDYSACCIFYYKETNRSIVKEI
jgi:hypothetical protein